MKALVIAEKPSVARDIARVLHCQKQLNGALEGNEYIVTWALGNLVTLADPEAYDKKYAQWKMEDLPMIPTKMELVVIKQTAKQYGAVKAQLFRQDVGSIIIATDAGREGELVARWILEKSGCKKPIKRLWISSVTDKAIREGFAHLKDGRAYNDLYQAAAARAQADWLVGINATRALTCKYNAQLSCGRVHTISEADRTSKKQPAPRLFDLTELQREANRRFGYSAKETLNICQRLYENHKVLTYPRTDSRYLSTDVVDTLKERLSACGVGPYKKLAGVLMSRPIKANASFVDNKKVSDHHAIIPTEQFVQLDHMTIDERRVYDLVVRRFLAVLYPPFVYEQVTVKGEAAGETFLAKGKQILSAGWKEVYEGGNVLEDEEETDAESVKEQTLPQLEKGSRLGIDRAEVTTGKTKPPAPFSEATLLSAMENPVTYLQTKNAQAAKTLGETGGLGTVATRADIIEKLFNSFLMEKRGKEIFLTSKGRQLLGLVPEDLKKPELTADWEMRLSKIAEGKLEKNTFIQDIEGYTRELTGEIRTGEGTFRHDNLTNKRCPQCGKRLLAVNGKNSRLLVCQDRECGYRETIARTSNARCPQCHRKMELVGKGEDETFICTTCGHKEKLSAFKKRREKEGAGVSKKDVQRYLNKQKKEAEEPVNNAFAAAFAKLKL